MTAGRRTSKVLSVDAGITRGSPISQILFLFFNPPFIQEYAISELQGWVEELVDYAHLIACGTSTEENCKTLEKAHEIYLEWAQKQRASFAPQKYEL